MNSLKFEGKGFTFFKIHLINVILSILSLSFLYPWAKTRKLKYIFEQTYMADNAFLYTGTAKGFFKLYIKTFLVFVLILAICFTGGAFSSYYKNTMFTGIIIYWFTIILTLGLVIYIFPVILHGSINFRFKNISWQSISPSYRGKLSEIVPLYFKGCVLTLLTIGVYKAWFLVRLLKYILRNIRFGCIRFDFSGEARPLFMIYLKGILLSLITFGIYGIWFAKELYEYTVNNIVVKKDDQEFKLRSDANTLEIFEMIISNCLLICLTLGIGASWAYMRYYRFIINHCVVPSEFNFSSLNEPQKTEEETETTGKKNWLDKLNPVLIA
jgi:uncharacterized membrane protein YjgN (DUF898 family)